MKNPDKMSERELRAEVVAWRKYGVGEVKRRRAVLAEELRQKKARDLQTNDD